METRIGIITVSDTRSTGAAEDWSGPAVEQALRALGFASFESRVVPDEIPAIQTALTELSERCGAVFTTGGTGFAPRDITPEATLPLLERLAPNLPELMRLKGIQHTHMSHLSRGVAGVRGTTLIVNLPGSPKAAREGVEALGPLLPHILSALCGDGCGHEC